jgi:ABC-type phosphate transport system substrate-binding protein
VKRKYAAWLLALTLGCGIWFSSQIRPVQAQGADALVVVVNKGNPAATGMSLADVKKMVLGEVGTWHNGSKVVVVLKPAGNSDRVAVLKKVCGMSEAIYTRYEMQASFTGQTSAVVNVASSDAAVKATVKANPGALGFLLKSQVDDSVKAVLTLD